MADARWLLLAHHLPARPSNARVKTWRHLNRIGAVAVRNSVYVLPNREPCREDFEWLCGEIAALGGEASIFAADVVDNGGGDEIIRAFQAARSADYHTLTREARRLARGRSRHAATQAARKRLSRSIRALRDRFAALEAVDFFTAPGRQDAAGAIEALEKFLAGPFPTPAVSTHLSDSDYHNRRWVTRPRPGVDRMASAWLIRRFIDHGAIFTFAEKPQDGTVAFDMFGGEFTHESSHCTFETLVDRFGIADNVVGRLAQIVHDLDLKETRFAPPEAAGVGRMIEGLRQVHESDAALLDHGIAMFEALARSFETTDRGENTRPPRGTRPHANPRKMRRRGAN